jgi:hypothetical protein
MFGGFGVLLTSSGAYLIASAQRSVALAHHQ